MYTFLFFTFYNFEDGFILKYMGSTSVNLKTCIKAFREVEPPEYSHKIGGLKNIKNYYNYHNDS